MLFEGSSLSNYHSYGKWIDGCGKFFLFSKKNAIFAIIENFIN
jgi:hypothetical protein